MNQNLFIKYFITNVSMKIGAIDVEARFRVFSCLFETLSTVVSSCSFSINSLSVVRVSNKKKIKKLIHQCC